MSRILTDRARTGCYIVSEAANPQRSREQATLKAGNDLPAGTVVAEVSTGVFSALVAAGAGVDAAASTPAGILYDNVDALAESRRAVFTVRDMEANGHELVWPNGFNAAAIKAAEAKLADIGIIVRY